MYLHKSAQKCQLNPTDAAMFHKTDSTTGILTTTAVIDAENTTLFPNENRMILITGNAR